MLSVYQVVVLETLSVWPELTSHYTHMPAVNLSITGCADLDFTLKSFLINHFKIKVLLKDKTFSLVLFIGTKQSVCLNN